MYRLITLVFHFAYGFRHFFSLMKKRTPKKIKAVQYFDKLSNRGPLFCLVVTAEAKKTRPFIVQMAYALLGTVGLKHFFWLLSLSKHYRLHSCKIGGSVIELVEILQGRSALRVWLRGIFVALGFCTRRNTK
jgi:hypothetical protein